MAWEIPNLTISLKAAGDLSSDQYKFMTLDSSGDAVLCTAVTDIPVGVLQNKPDAAGKVAQLMVIGAGKVKAVGALTIGWLIGTFSDGLAERKTPGTETTEFIVGQVLEATGAANELATALINCASPARAA